MQLFVRFDLVIDLVDSWSLYFLWNWGSKPANLQTCLKTKSKHKAPTKHAVEAYTRVWLWGVEKYVVLEMVYWFAIVDNDYNHERNNCTARKVEWR